MPHERAASSCSAASMPTTSYPDRAPSPSPARPCCALVAQASPGGKGANQAIAAAARRRSDPHGRFCGRRRGGESPLLDALAASRRRHSRRISKRPRAAYRPRDRRSSTTHAENSIIVSSRRQRAFLDAAVAYYAAPAIRADDVLRPAERAPCRSPTARQPRIARAAGATVVWNAAPAPTSTADDLIDVIDLLVVNEHELVLLVDDSSASLAGCPPAPAIRRLDPPTALALTSASGLLVVVCTLGADGSIFVDRRTSPTTCPPHACRRHRHHGCRRHRSSVTSPARCVPISVSTSACAPAAGALTVTRPGASSSIPPSRRRRALCSPARTAE